MHTIDLLQQALDVAKRSGIRLRCEWLHGTSGGLCRIGTHQYLFVDLSLTATEQLDQVVQALRLAPNLEQASIPERLKRLIR